MAEVAGDRRVTAPVVPDVATHTLLGVHGLDVHHGNLQVLFGLDLHVAPGQVLAVLGPNGAGKTTLLRTLAGLHQPSAGTIELAGADITALGAERRVSRGIVLVEGGNAIFPSLTVAENLRAGLHLRRHEPRHRRDEARKDALAAFPILGKRLHQRAGTLSGGERQMLAIAKALLLDAQVLCIDELSLGLAPVVVQQLVERVAVLRDAGRTMIIVEQSVSVALSLADHALVLEKGHVRLTGPTVELREQLDRLEAAMLGAVS